MDSNKPYIIGINGYYLQVLSAGIGQYTYNLLMSLAALDNNNHYYIFVPYLLPDIRLSVPLPENFKFVITHPKGDFSNTYTERFMWERYTLSRLAKQYKVDVFHAPYQSLPARLRGKSLVTIHDAIPWFFDFQRSDWVYRTYTNLSRMAARGANKIITVSEASKSQIMPIYNLKPEYIEVVREPVNPLYSTVPSGAEIAGVLKSYKISKKYILHTGGLKRHKNVATLIQAYVAMMEKYRLDVDLVIVGTRKRNTTTNNYIYYAARELESIAVDPAIAKRVKFIGSVNELELNALYHGASILVSLSLQEGFGLPLVEGMVAGCPVIVSDIPAHSEIAAGAAILVNAFGASVVAEKMYAFLTDKKLSQKYIELGRERAKEFNYGDFGARMLGIYDELHNDRSVYRTQR